MKYFSEYSDQFHLFNLHSVTFPFNLTLSWRGPLLYRNQSIDLQGKSVDWFLYDNGLRHERFNYPPAFKNDFY